MPVSGLASTRRVCRRALLLIAQLSRLEKAWIIGLTAGGGGKLRGERGRGRREKEERKGEREREGGREREGERERRREAGKKGEGENMVKWIRISSPIISAGFHCKASCSTNEH